jgi:putative transposase
VMRMVDAVEARGRAALIRTSRSDKGGCRYVSQPWRELVLALYKHGQRYSRRVNRNQIWALIQATSRKLEKVKDGSSQEIDDCIKRIATDLGVAHQSHTTSINKILKQIKDEVKAGQFEPPRSHRMVYKIVDAYLEEENRKIHHNSQSLPRRMQTLDGEIIVDESNKVYEIDDTPSDVLLVDAEGNEIGCPILAIVVEGYSGCVAGYHIGFTEPGAFEMGLALRHAILPKQYGPEYQLQTSWDNCGTPEHLVTDRAKAFKCEHLTEVARELHIHAHFRAYPSQGGHVETVFDKFNKEFHSFLLGYKGSNVLKRPKNAEKWAGYTIEEYERLLVRFIVDHWNQHDYPRMPEQRRIERWRSMLIELPKVPNERDLDICMLKSKHSPLVYRGGEVRFAGEIYRDERLCQYVGQGITIRYDPSNIIHILIYAGTEEYVVRARDLKEERLSLRELKQRKRGINKARRERDQSATDDERLSLFGSGQKKASETRKKRREKEHDRTGRSSTLANVVEFKRKEESNSLTQDEASLGVAIEPQPDTTQTEKPKRKRYQPPTEFTGEVVHHLNQFV